MYTESNPSLPGARSHYAANLQQPAMVSCISALMRSSAILQRPATGLNEALGSVHTGAFHAVR